MPGPDYKPEQPLTEGQKAIMAKLRGGPRFDDFKKTSAEAAAGTGVIDLAGSSSLTQPDSAEGQQP